MDLEDTANVIVCKCNNLHDPESPTTPTNDQTIEDNFDKLIASGNSMNLITTLMTPIGRKSFTPTSTPVKKVTSLRPQSDCSHYKKLSDSFDFASDDEDNAKIKEAIDKSIMKSQENYSKIDKRRHFIKVLPDSPHKELCPKIAKILENGGLDKYKDVFIKEEIDYFVFEMMTEDDFITIGIDSKSERDYLLNIVQ